MKKISIFVFVFSTVIILTSCTQPGPDFSKMERSKTQWSFVKSPKTGQCYEIIAHREFTGYAWTGYSGMAQVNNKYCK